MTTSNNLLDQLKEKSMDRGKLGIPPLPLTADETAELFKLVAQPPEGQEDRILELVKNRIPAGVDEAAQVKACALADIATGKTPSPLLSKEDAVRLLGAMGGGYSVKELAALLDNFELGPLAAQSLKHCILIFGAFDDITEIEHPWVAELVKSWADAEWFTSRPKPSPVYKRVVFKVEGEINTDDFSPASHAPSRPDIPLHALAMGESRFPGGIDEMVRLRAETGLEVAFAGDVVGTGSSRKSACNSLIWHIGRDIPYVPNKRSGGIILGGQIAPIFFNTARDAGALPLMVDVQKLNTGDIIEIDTEKGEIRRDEQVIVSFSVQPVSLFDEVRAGGRVPLLIGKDLTNRAREFKGLPASDVFLPMEQAPESSAGYTLAQKMVGRACGTEGVRPGAFVMPIATTVGSQDTTGPMTRDEMKDLACLRFEADLVMQSFCHTAAYPGDKDKVMHATLPDFIRERAGVSLLPGDGIIHAWLNRLLLPDTVGTGGDSHTRFPIGISFPAGSGLVAFAAALGRFPLDMPESVLVRFKGSLRPGVTLRDVVNAIPWFAQREGLLVLDKGNRKNIFNGRILEMEGLNHLSVEEAFELTDASAERSAAAATFRLSQESIVKYLKSNIVLIDALIEDGYGDQECLNRRRDEMEEWVEHPPKLLRADENAEYAEVLEIDLSEIDQPILACPNDPDLVKKLDEVAGNKIDEVFLGSCMLNAGHFRAAAELLKSEDALNANTWLSTPTRMDEAILEDDGTIDIFRKLGARIEVSGCSLCMGNQARVADNAFVMSTSTRNFNNRIGKGAQVFLGSAELAALTAALGKLPDSKHYFQKVSALHGKEKKLYQTPNFSLTPEFARKK